MTLHNKQLFESTAQEMKTAEQGESSAVLEILCGIGGLMHGVKDTRPITRRFSNFDMLCDALESHASRYVEKDGPYICAPMGTEIDKEAPGRGDKFRQPFAIAPIDFDGKPNDVNEKRPDLIDTPEEAAERAALAKQAYDEARANRGGLKAFFYTTSSYTAENPSFRVMVALTREATAPECAAIYPLLLEAVFSEDTSQRNAAMWKKKCLDMSAARGAQIMFTPRKDAETLRLLGKPFDVDAALEEAAKRNKSAKPVTDQPRQANASAVPPAAGGLHYAGKKTLYWKPPVGYTLDGQKLNTELDPYLHRLRELGLLKGKNKNGGYNIRCPFGDHDEGADSSTVYYPPDADSPRTDSNGDPYTIGCTHCFHGTCEGRKQADYCRAVGVSYDDYLRWCQGETPTCFKAVAAQGKRYIFENNGRSLSVRTVTAKRNDETEPLEYEIGTEHKFASALTLEAASFDEYGESNAVHVSFNARNGRRVCEIIRLADLYGTNSGDALKGLIDSGFSCAPDAATFLRNYLSMAPIGLLPSVTSKKAVGWCSPVREATPVFVTSEGNFGPQELRERIYFAGKPQDAAAVALSGHEAEVHAIAEAWRNEVAVFALSSSRIALAVCAGFAAPCLAMLGQEGGGFNLVGPSSKGKSKALHAAASIYGKPDTYIREWGSTATGLLSTCFGHNDMLLCLDEASTAEKGIGRVCYAIGNGVDKMRSNTRLGLERQRKWRVLALSSSEKTIAEMLAETERKTINAGQEVRLTNLSACPVSSDLGVFDRLPDGCECTLDAVRRLQKAAGRRYGAAGWLWLDYLSNHYAEAKERLTAHFERIGEDWASSLNVGSQGGRVLDRFVACAAAGELATEQGLTGWTPGFATEQVRKCARDALKAFAVDRELLAALKHLREAYTVNASNFIRLPLVSTWGEPRHGPALWGLRWQCKRGGDPLKPIDADAQEYTTGQAAPHWGVADFEAQDAPTAEATPLVPVDTDSMALFNSAAFEALVKPMRRDDASTWLKEKGALLVIDNQRGKSALNASRIRRAEFKRASGRGEVVGFIVNMTKLEALLTAVEAGEAV